MKIQRKRALTAWLLAVGILLTCWPIWGAGAAQAVDLSQKCGLTITSGTIEDLKNANVVIDLYKVADAEANPDYDTYGYRLAPAYAGLQDGLAANPDNDGWRTLAAAAADVALKGEVPVAQVDDGVRIDNLDCGLYLMIARGKDVKDYTGTDEEGGLVTIARSGEYVYSFFPELVSLPSTQNLTGEPGQEIMTSDGTWLYDVSAVLKPAQAVRFGSLEIVKNLPVYDAAAPATFVFQVEAYTDETRSEVVYSNVASVSFTAAGSQSVLLEKVIPVGAYVEVTEVYSGTAYEVSGSGVQTAVIEAGSTASVNFTNTYNGGGNNGGAIINHFSYAPDPDDPEKGWDWNQEKA